jgi:hypothetical protein
MIWATMAVATDQVLLRKGALPSGEYQHVLADRIDDQDLTPDQRQIIEAGATQVGEVPDGPTREASRACIKSTWAHLPRPNNRSTASAT